MPSILLLTAYCLRPPALSAQQPQAQAGQEIFPVNAKFVQGFGPGYWPTAGSNLILNLAPGTAVCRSVVQTYAGGTLALAPSATNYVYLDPSNSCAPASNTTGFTTAVIPIATVVTTSAAISSVTDVRTMFVSNGAATSGTVTSVAMAGDGIIFSQNITGSPITSSGTLTPQLLTQSANTILAGPGSGAAAPPSFRALVPADLPATISSNTTGNAATATALASSPAQCIGNNWATGVSSNGNANCSQPAFSNLSGTATVLQGGTGHTTANAGFNALSPLTTEGDLVYFHSSANARLARGSSGQCLTSNGTDPVWGSCSGSGATTGLGNGTTVIDASLQPGADFSTKVNAAIAVCSPGPCTYDLRGFTGSQTMSVNIQFPADSDVIMGPMTINMATGTQFLLSNNTHIHGSTSGPFTSLVKTNTTNDYTPVIYGTSGNSSGVEIDHIWIGVTTPSSSEFPVTSVAASSGGTAVYTGTFPSCGSNACAGFEFGVWGFQGTWNEGYFTATASTTTTLTLSNASATAETAPPYLPGGTFAVQSGGWGIAAPFSFSHLHDIFSESDLGLKLVDSGCGCYNDFENLNLWSGHGALYLGASTASLTAKNIVAWAADDNSVSYASASGYGVRALNGSAIKFDGLDIENTAYSIVVKTGGFQVDNLYLENDHTSGLGLSGEKSLPILMQGAHNVKLPFGVDVVDLSNAGNPSFGANIYGTTAGFGAQIPNPVYGSLVLTPITIAGYNGDASVGAGSGTSPYSYWMVGVDGSGNKTAPVAYKSTPLNQALGPYTLTLTAASAANEGLTTYTGIITGGAGGGLDNNTFTISGFTNSGNNGTFSCPTSTSTTLVCTNSAGVAETNYGSAASDAYNVINGPFVSSGAGVKCVDILKGSTSQSLATCVPPSIFPLHDDGSITLQAYTTPTRNGTGDAYVPGKLSTTKNVLDDGSGNIAASGKITSGANGFCITTNCLTAWPATPAFQINGTNTSNQTTINFVNGTYLTASNPSAGQVKFDITSLPLVGISGGGTGQTTASAAFNALSPMTTLGDLEYEGSSGAARLAGNTSSSKNFLISTGSSGAATAPLWGTISASDLPSTLVYTGQANTYSSGGKQTFGASTGSAASINTPAGTAPTSPVPGDYWYDGDRMYVKDAETNSGVVSSAPRRITITSAITASSTTAVTVGAFAVAGNKTYCLMCTLFVQSNNTSNKPTMLVTCPASPAASQFGFIYAPSTTTTAQADAACDTAMVSPTATSTTGSTFINSLSGMLQNGASAGSLMVQVESSGSYSTIIEPGSYCILY